MYQLRSSLVRFFSLNYTRNLKWHISTLTTVLIDPTNALAFIKCIFAPTYSIYVIHLEGQQHLVLYMSHMLSCLLQEQTPAFSQIHSGTNSIHHLQAGSSIPINVKHEEQLVNEGLHFLACTAYRSMMPSLSNTYRKGLKKIIMGAFHLFKSLVSFYILLRMAYGTS